MNAGCGGRKIKYIMNVLFITLLDFKSIEERNIYTDLLREFIKDNHKVYIISPVERRKKQNTYLVKENKATILKLKIGNTQKTNIIEKGISTVFIEPIFISGIKKYFSNIKFDLVLYSTPPITVCNVVDYVKKRDNAKTYLLLKDIFPQNAVDIGMMNTTGLNVVLYKFFRHKERELYRISDRIGCMSQANVDYVIKHNSEINSEAVEICPNSIEVVDRSVDEETRMAIRKKYAIPFDKKVFVYGGNLGRPQGIDFLIKCIHSQRSNRDIFFLIVGDGTEYGKLEHFTKKYPQDNLKLMQRLPKEDYDIMVAACDVGLIFLDYCFTIPNFPSRLLSYMQAKIPVLACTDPNTDIGKVIVDGDFGWWCESNSVEKFGETIKMACEDDLSLKAEQGFKYLVEQYSVNKSYMKIVSKM